MRMVRDQIKDTEKDPNQTLSNGETVSELRNTLDGIKSNLHIAGKKKSRGLGHSD